QDHGRHAPPPPPGVGVPDPYTVLGVAPNADERTVKHAYRKLMSEHHPDKLGDVPEVLRRRAEERAREINAAYERIKNARRFK
ncbi:MAG TPA: DnaJ domain-containing protein, partial [Tahibacter sp.]|nr:DnaJ domain-containing protein [Tahibacter sp.]